jgi:voltage-gated potassium channel
MSSRSTRYKPKSGWRRKWFTVIYEADTPGGKLFDIILLILILFSVLTVMLETVSFVKIKYGSTLLVIEWILTGLFTIEYVLRLIITTRPGKYALSFMGVIDLLAIIPTYIAFFFAGSSYLITIRALRLVRVFRILKLTRFIGEAQTLSMAMKNSRHKITVFMVTVTAIVTIIGTVLYMVEGPEHGFNSIPKSIYWAIVTLTTVGYGDISPQTALGQFIASIVMILGYAIIAVPTGIVSVEMNKAQKKNDFKTCPKCHNSYTPIDAHFCPECGTNIEEYEENKDSEKP